jgi:putative ABC transport system ATP-binding protein
MILKTEGLTLAYEDVQETVYAVRDVTFSLPNTGLHAILGPSGSGKTSLLYLISGIKPPTDGTIFFQDTPLPEDSQALTSLRREKMGFVFQQHFLINYLTVLENVLVGASAGDKQATARAHELLKELGLDALEKRKPYQLSGGQRQRVAIARAFIHSPQIVFVDEPTASLDKSHGEKVVELLSNFAKNSCVVIVTHDEDVLSQTDSAYRMRDGILIQIKGKS